MGKTGYFTHRDCWKHDMGRGHPECPERLDAIEDRLLLTGVGDALEHRDVPLATLAQITRAHSEAHLEYLEELHQRLVADEPAGGPAHAMLDPDTILNRYTLLAARRAAGAAIAATDAVMAGEVDNAFCRVVDETTQAELARYHAEVTEWEQREYWLRLALLWGAAAHERCKNAASTPSTTQPTSASS